MSHQKDDLSGRKSDHLDLAISGDVGFRSSGLLEEVGLVHCSLPEIAVAEIETQSELAGMKVRTPVMIAAMTGGNERAYAINQQLAQVAQEGGYAIGLGSQRAMIKTGTLNAEVTRSYQVRNVAPDVPLLANIGVVQASESPTALICEMIQAVDANALCIHLNPAQEMIQPGGDRDFRGGLDAIGRLVSEVPVPIIVKETGCGISRKVAERLRAVGVLHLDVSGAGGTSWVGVETRRAEGRQKVSGELFWDWGIPTAASLLQVRGAQFRTLIASGGIKSGLDVARAVALGATMAGIARPVLQALDEGGILGATQYLKQVELDLTTALLLTGCRTLKDLASAPRLLGPNLARWADV